MNTDAACGNRKPYNPQDARYYKQLLREKKHRPDSRFPECRPPRPESSASSYLEVTSLSREPSRVSGEAGENNSSGLLSGIKGGKASDWHRQLEANKLRQVMNRIAFQWILT
jgi:hypothetical protein